MNRMRSLMTMTLIALLAGSFSACGYIDHSKKTFTNEELVEKAASSIGVETSDLSIVQGSVQTTRDQISYRVQDRAGDRYRCYFAVIQGVVGYVTSGSGNANCTKIVTTGIATGSRL